MGITLVVVARWLARQENVRVSNESQRRPRLRITTTTASVSAPVPESAR